MTKPEIVNYQDYRQYLQDLFWWKKNHSPIVSYEYCAIKMETSKTYLKQIFDKKSHLKLDKLDGLAKIFELKSYEVEMLILFIVYESIADSAIKEHFQILIERSKNYIRHPGAKAYLEKISDRSKEDEEHWLDYAIKGLSYFKDFIADGGWIQRHLRDQVDIELIQSRLDKLISSKQLIEVNGRIIDREPFDAENALSIHSAKKYLIGVGKTFEVLDHTPFSHSPANFFQGALAFDDQGLQKASELYYQYLHQVIALSHETQDPKHLVFISNNIFALNQR